MKSFSLKIVTPDGIEFDGMAETLLLRTTEGDIQILAGHADLICAVGTGRVKIGANGTYRSAAASGGFLTVTSGEVRLAATTFEYAEEIDVARAKRAKERAEQAIADRIDAHEQEVAKAKLLRALTRLNVSEQK